MGEAQAARKVTTHTLRELKAKGQRAVCVTAYDYPTATFADRAGVDLILVGDSAAMTVLGHANTLSITMTDMLVFARAVARGAKRAFVLGDLPFLSYQVSDADAITNAGAFLAAGCDAVKCEGGRRVAPRGYRVQGKTRAQTAVILDDAKALEDAGAFAILLEALPPESAAFVRENLSIPVYGIGAGPHVDGQLVISHDLLGNFVGEVKPRFVSRLASVDAVVTEAFSAYADQVRSAQFPAPEHWYSLDSKELISLATAS